MQPEVFSELYDVASSLRFGLLYVIGILSVRTLPFVAFALWDRQTTTWAKLTWGGAFGLLVVAQRPQVDGQWQLLLLTALAYGYFFFICNVVQWLHEQRALKRVGRWTAFGTNLLLCWLIPTVLLSGRHVLVFYMLSAEMTLAAYSYCAEAAKPTEGRTLVDCRFFLLVNPVLVWRARGQRTHAPGLAPSGALRLLLGCAAMAFGLCLNAWREHASSGRELPLLEQSVLSLEALGHAMPAFMALYAAHSGLASIQIGCMRLIGYEVPESYEYPFLSTRPTEFWARWNLWVGGWFRIYAFMPLARFLRRRSIPIALAYILALMGTFLAVGLYHDAIVWTSTATFTVHAVAWFAVAGLAVVLWAGASRIRILKLTTPDSKARHALQVVVQVFGYVAFLHLALVALALW